MVSIRFRALIIDGGTKGFLHDLHSSFPEIHKVDNIGIFVQLLTDIIWNYLRNESISM